MKKFLLSLVTLFSATAAMAQMPQLYEKISGDDATRVYASQKSAEDMEAAVKAFDESRVWSGANLFYVTGETLYSDDEITLTALGQGDSGELRVYDSAWGADVTAAKTFNENINYLAILGSNAINKNVLDGTEVLDYSAPKTFLNKAGNGAVVVVAKKAGVLKAQASRGSNNSNIAIWQVANAADIIEAQKVLDAAEANDNLTDAEYEAEIARGNALKVGKWVAYTNYESAKDGSKNGVVEGQIDTEHIYLIVSLSNNNAYLHYVAFTPEGSSVTPNLGVAETWSVTSILPEDFNGKQAADAEGVFTIKDGSAYIYGETDNVKVTYCSSPNGNSGVSGKSSDLDECLAGTKTWTDLRGNMDPANNKVYNETFRQCLMGRGNPGLERSYRAEETENGYAERVDEVFYEPGCGKLPQVGTYVEFEVAKAGTLEAVLMVWRPNNPLYIIDEATNEPLAPALISYKGWVNNNTTEWFDRVLADDYLPHYNTIKNEEGEVVRPGDPGKELAAAFKFEVKAGKYMAISPKSQIGFYGYNFYVSDDPTGIENVEAVRPVVKTNVIYNLAGQKVGADYKGIVIKNGKKVLVK